MKNSETTGKNNYIFETTESDCPNNINQSISDYDKDSLNESTRNNAHRSKRLMISRRSSKKKVPEIKNENTGSSEILKTEIPNQKVIYPTPRTEEEANDPKNLSFTNHEELDRRFYDKKNSIIDSNNSNSNKFMIGRNILDTHRSNLIDIVNKNFPQEANLIEEKHIKNNIMNSAKEVTNDHSPLNKNKNVISDSNDNNKFILKKTGKNSQSNYGKNISDQKKRDNIDNNLCDYYDYNINETSVVENQNSKSASIIFHPKKDSSNYLSTQRSDNFHKKNYYENSSFRRTYDNFNNYTASSKSRSKEKKDIEVKDKKYILLSKKEADKKENKLMLSVNSNKDKDNKFKIKPIGKTIKIKRNDYLQENEKQGLKKNYSESPTIKKNNFLITENTNIDYSTKSNANVYKRNNSSNINTNPNNQFNEESIELIIPTPYPKNPYMSLGSPNLTNSPYTQLLNKKYPARKYLKHNLSSWLRYNNKHASDYKEINIKLMNPKVDFKRDFNLKKLTYKNEDILDNTAESMTDIKKACELINALKTKLLEYEITNNKNIDLAVEQIEKLEHENNFFRQKLLASYEELNFYKDKYDDDVLETNGLYDHRRYLVKNLRSKWLKQKFFYGLKNRIDYLKKLRVNYKNFLNRKCFLLMFKGFLSLEKNRINSVVIRKVQAKRDFNLRKKAFNFLKKNQAFKRLIDKFANIQKQICLILTFKNLRYNLTLKKYYSDLNKKGLLRYYLKTARKIFTVLKRNLLEQSSTPHYTKKFEDSRKINFINFFKNLKNGNKLSNLDKTKKTKGLSLLKNLVEKKIVKMSVKYSSDEFKEYSENKFFKWKKKTFIPMKLRTFHFIFALKLMQFFFKRVKNTLNIRRKKKTFSSSIYSPRTSLLNVYNNSLSKNEFSPFSSNSFNQSRRSYYNNFLIKCAEKIRNRQKDTIQRFKDFSKQIHFRMFVDLLKSMQFSNPLMRFTRVYRKLQFSIFFDKVKTQIQLRKKGEHLITKFNTFGAQNKKLDAFSNYSGSTIFTERKYQKKHNNNNVKAQRTIEEANNAAANEQDRKITQKTLFNLGKKFFRIVKYKSKIKDYYDKLIYKFKKQYIYIKNADKLIRRILLKKIFSRKSQFENKLINIKKIIEEKSDMILKIEHENNELRKHYENSRKETKATLLENEALRERIKELEERLHYDDVNFKELFNKNLNDIKNLHSLLKNNEALLVQAKKREEDLQNKYCSDIQKAVSLNKQLNNIISKKNKLIADIKIKQNKKEAEATNETLKLYKENANLYNEYNKIMEIKEIEKHSLEEEKNKLKTDLEQLEMEKIKSEYKSTILEEENKLIYNQIIENIKQKK